MWLSCYYKHFLQEVAAVFYLKLMFCPLFIMWMLILQYHWWYSGFLSFFVQSNYLKTFILFRRTLENIWLYLQIFYSLEMHWHLFNFFKIMSSWECKRGDLFVQINYRFDSNRKCKSQSMCEGLPCLWCNVSQKSDLIVTHQMHFAQYFFSEVSCCIITDICLVCCEKWPSQVAFHKFQELNQSTDARSQQSDWASCCS